MNAPPIILFPAGVEYSSITESDWDYWNEYAGNAWGLEEVPPKVFFKWTVAARAIREKIDITFDREVTDQDPISYEVDRTRDDILTEGWTHDGTPPIVGFTSVPALLYLGFPNKIPNMRAFVRRGGFYFLVYYTIFEGEDEDHVIAYPIYKDDEGSTANVTITESAITFTASRTISYEGFNQVETSEATYTITDVYQTPPP